MISNIIYRSARHNRAQTQMINTFIGITRSWNLGQKCTMSADKYHPQTRDSWKTVRRNVWRVLELIHRPVAYYKKNNHNFLLGRGTTVEELTYLWFCVFTYSVRIMVVVCVSDCTCCCGRWLRSKAAEKRREDIPISWFLGDWGWNWNVEQTQWIVDSHRSQVKSISNVERGREHDKLLRFVPKNWPQIDLRDLNAIAFSIFSRNYKQIE